MDNEAYIKVKWQEGTILKNGRNGAQVNEVLDFALARLEKLDQVVPCEENKNSMYFIKQAMKEQNNRTKIRIAEGKEGYVK